jgi:hypothetical protein
LRRETGLTSHRELITLDPAHIDVLQILRHVPLLDMRGQNPWEEGMWYGGDSQRSGRVKVDVHGLGYSDAVRVLNETEDYQRGSAAADGKGGIN